MATQERGARLSVSHSGTNLTRAGNYNQRVVLRAIRSLGETTRGDLAAMTGLSAPTIANITRRLELDGLIRTAGRLQKGLGQPPLRIAINPDGGFGIGINIDRDHISLVSLDLAGRTRTCVSREIAYPLPPAVRAFVAKEMQTLIASGNIDPARIVGVGLAVPEPFSKPGFHKLPAEYKEWNHTDLRSLFADLLPWPIHVDNDAAAAAVGELNFGEGREFASFFYMLISAGLGGGLVIDGAFFRGATGRSGEIGFLPGRTGATTGQPIENRVSLSALYDRLSDAGCKAESLAALHDPEPRATAVIHAWIDEAVELLLDPLIAVNCLINPDAILVGGRLPEPLIDRLVDRLRRRMDDHAASLPAIACIRRATMASVAPAIGAALLPFIDRLLPSDSILMTSPVEL